MFWPVFASIAIVFAVYVMSNRAATGRKRVRTAWHQVALHAGRLQEILDLPDAESCGTARAEISSIDEVVDLERISRERLANSRDETESREIAKTLDRLEFSKHYFNAIAKAHEPSRIGKPWRSSKISRAGSERRFF